MKLEEFVTKLCNEKSDLNQKNAESTIAYLQGIETLLTSKVLEEVKAEQYLLKNYTGHGICKRYGSLYTFEKYSYGY